MMISMELENLPINPGTATLSNQSHPVGGFKKIIIVGAGRTGTTAITSVIQELGFFTGVDNKREKPSLENEKLDELLALQQYSQLLDRLSEMASQNNRVVWKGLKLMGKSHIDFVSSLPMDIGIVIVFRDILATAVRKTIVSDTDLIQEMASAIQANKKILKVIQLNQNNKLLISYEKLLTSTPEVVKSIADFCGDIDPHLLAPAASQITTKPIEYLKVAADFIEKRKPL
jgi:hypothetical protein